MRAQLPVLLAACALCALVVWLMVCNMTENDLVDAPNITATVIAGIYALTLPPAYAYSFWVVKNADLRDPREANIIIHLYMGYGSGLIWTLPIFISPLFFYYYIKELFKRDC